MHLDPIHLDIVDETIGTSAPEARTLRASLTLDLETVTVADLIRFRVEDGFERGIDDPVLATRTVSETETTLNPEAARERAFSGVAEAELERIGRDAARIDAAVARALAAFEAGVFLLIVNDAQMDDPAAPIPMKSINEACFVRLLPLQGG